MSHRSSFWLSLFIALSMVLQSILPITPVFAFPSLALTPELPPAAPSATSAAEVATPELTPPAPAPLPLIATITPTLPITPTVTPMPTPTQVEIEAEAEDGIEVSNLNLDLTLDPPWAAPGEVVTFTVTATNLQSAPLARLVLTDTLPAGLVYVAQSAAGFAYEPNAKQLTWQVGDLATGAVITGTFQARMQGLALGETVINTVTAASPTLAAGVTAQAAVDVVAPRNNEAWVTPGEGGTLRSIDDRVLLRIPPGAVERRVLISYHPRSDRVQLTTGIRFPFELTASDEIGGVVRDFPSGLRLSYVYDPVTPQPTLYQEPTFFLFEPTQQQWVVVPSVWTAQTGQLTTIVTRFSTYAAGSADYLVERMSSLRGAQTNLFTRSIGYNYGFELPPGRGGLTPLLGLSYSSGNHTPGSGHFSLAGYGWQISGADAIYIAPGDPNTFKPTLSLQGVTYSLRQTRYGAQWSDWFARENPFLKIQTANESHYTMGTWYIWTPAGYKYTFDALTTAHEYYWKLCGTGDLGKRYVRIPLTSITDPQGNAVNYTWEAEEDSTGPDPCPNHHRGVRLKTISYNGGTVQVVLDYTARLDRPEGYDGASWRFYTTKKLATVTIQVKEVSTGTWRTVWRYALGHNPQTETQAVSQKVLNLDWLQEQTDADAAWPRATFGYTNQWFSTQDEFGALTWARNGFGGEVNYTTTSGQPRLVTARTEKDGLDSTTDPTWTYSSSAWVDGGTSNEESLASGFGEVDVTDPGGAITKHFYHLTDIVAGGKIDARAGRESLTEVWSGGVKLRWTATTWISDTAQLPIAGLHAQSAESLKPRFVYAGETKTYEAGQNLLRTTYEYEPVRQVGSQSGGKQFGNLTRVKEFEGAGSTFAATPTRVTSTWYYPNESLWLLNLAAVQKVYAGNETTLVAESRNYYEHSVSYTAPPTKPLLTTAETVGVKDGAYSGGTLATTYDYEGNGNQSWVRDPLNRQTSYVYDTWFQAYRVCETNAVGHSRKLFYYGVPGGASCNTASGTQAFTGNRFGQLEKETDANDASTLYGYDDLGRVTAVARPGDTLAIPTVSYVYYDALIPFRLDTHVREVSGCAGCFQPTITFLDGFGRVIQTKAEAQNGSAMIVTDTRYNTFGQVESQYVPYTATDSATFWDYLSLNTAQPKTTTLYDALGRVSQVIAPDGTVNESVYRVEYNAADADFRATQQAVYKIDANRHFVRRAMDPFGNLRSVSESTGLWPAGAANPTWGDEYRTRYTYDKLGRLTNVRDHVGNMTTLVYDAYGRKEQMSDPDMGTWQYRYDAAGNLVQQIDGNNNLIDFEYDGLNRLTRQTD